MRTRVTSSVLENTSVLAGVYGGGTNTPVITIDAQGRITSASNNQILTSTTPTAGDSSTRIATTAYVQTVGYNSQGRKIISTSVPTSTVGFTNGDIWYKY